MLEVEPKQWKQGESCRKGRERKRLQEEAKLLLPSSVIFAISIHPSIKMIFGSKALSVAVLSALVFSDEASAATAKKGKHNNKTLRKAYRKLKGSKGGSDDGMATRAGPGETLSIPGMPAIEPRMIDIPDAGGDGGDEVEVDSLVQADATVPGTCGIDIDFTDNMCMAKYKYAAVSTYNPARACVDALKCYETGDTTQMTFKYTATTDCAGSYGDCFAFSDKAQGGRVWIVENTDMFQMKLPNVPDPTYDSLKWHVENDLKNAMPMGKTLYNEEVWVGDEFSIPLNSLTAARPEIAYMAFDKNGNLISFVTFDPYSCGSGDYSIGGRVGNAEISSFKSTEFGTITSQVYIDKYMYDVVNNCAGNDNDDAIVYSLDRTFCTSSCGQDKWDCPTAEGYNPFSCVVDGKTQLGCDGSTTVAAVGNTTFTDSIDGKGPVDLLTTKFQLNVDATVRYPEYWIERSASATSPEIAVPGC